MDHKIRLGPIAIFLTIVAIVLSTLAVLTAATAGADKVMAERFASVTQIRYELESEGEQYLQKIDGLAAEGKLTAEAAGAEKVLSGGLKKTITKSGYTLTIETTDPGESGKYEVTGWKITREWNAEDPFSNIWQGGGSQ